MKNKVEFKDLNFIAHICIQRPLLLLIVVILVNCAKEDAVEPAPKPSSGPKPILFAAMTYGSVKDIEGNSYKTIAIGNQTWMAENLRTTTFEDGSPIPTNLTQTEWTSATASAVCNYEDNSANVSLYGSLYNQFTVSDSRKVCPSGWHIPSTEDWTQLANEMGGIEEAGSKLKETGTTHWVSPNTGENSSGFTGLPGGSRYRGRFADMGYDGYWWSADAGRFFYLTNQYAKLRTKTTGVNDDGLAIRCVKN